VKRSHTFFKYQGLMVTSVIMMLICYNESFPGHLIWAASSLQDTFNYQTVSFANDRFFYDNKYSFDGFSWVQLDTGFFKDKCFGKVIYDGKRYIAMNSSLLETAFPIQY
jgi:hypothetical protein